MFALYRYSLWKKFVLHSILFKTHPLHKTCCILTMWYSLLLSLVNIAPYWARIWDLRMDFHFTLFTWSSRCLRLNFNEKIGLSLSHTAVRFRSEVRILYEFSLQGYIFFPLVSARTQILSLVILSQLLTTCLDPWP